VIDADPIARLRILRESESVALVGVSANPLRSSNFVATYLLRTPYRIYPVNPNYDRVLGLQCYPSLADLPEGATLGTASIRRQAQALAVRPDLKVVLLRGNVDTRLGKVRSGEVDATFLARAGLRRLGRAEAERPALDPAEMLPAAGQGAVCIEIRETSSAARKVLERLNHGPTECAVVAERAFLAALDGSCRTPIAAYARIEGDELHLVGEALLPDGSQRWRAEGRCEAGDPKIAHALGFRLGLDVGMQGGEILRRAVAETGGAAEA